MRDDNIQHGQTTQKHSNIQRKKKGYTPKTEKYPENPAIDTVAQQVRQTLGLRDVWAYKSAVTVIRKSLSLHKKPSSNELLGSDWPQRYKHAHVPGGYDVFLH